MAIRIRQTNDKRRPRSTHVELERVIAGGGDVVDRKNTSQCWVRPKDARIEWCTEPGRAIARNIHVAPGRLADGDHRAATWISRAATAELERTAAAIARTIPIPKKGPSYWIGIE